MHAPMTVSQAAAIIGITPRRVLQLLDSGEITGERLTPRMWLVNRQSVMSYAKKPESKVGRPRKKSVA